MFSYGFSLRTLVRRTHAHTLTRRFHPRGTLTISLLRLRTISINLTVYNNLRVLEVYK